MGYGCHVDNNSLRKVAYILLDTPKSFLLGVLVIWLPISSWYYTITLGNFKALILSCEVKEHFKSQGSGKDAFEVVWLNPPSFPKAEDTEITSKKSVEILKLKNLKRRFLSIYLLATSSQLLLAHCSVHQLTLSHYFYHPLRNWNGKICNVLSQLSLSHTPRTSRSEGRDGMLTALQWLF